MNNEHFMQKISATRQEIIDGAKDPKAMGELVDQILLEQAQLDVIPVELIVEEKSVVKRYPVTDAIEVVRCKTAIFLHATCFWVVSKPSLANNGRGGALYEMLDWYCDYMDDREEYDEEERERFDAISAAIINILTLPMDAFTDMDYCLAVATDILHQRTEYYNRLSEEAEKEHEETFEDAVEDAAMAAEDEFNKELARELQDLAEKNKKTKDGA